MLKRTIGNDCVLLGRRLQGVYDLIGEYYYPYLSYPSNAILGDSPFEGTGVRKALVYIVQARLKTLIPHTASTLCKTSSGSSQNRLRSC
jgi:hypothetical protein